ncbi:MAG: hypothetical protein J1F13_04210 [Prevotellaceae bacterium]|nr:hypothetical protein [Prevotellaceae bacterium]
MKKIKLIALLVICMSFLMPSCHRATLEEQCAEMVKKERRRMPRNITTGVVLDSMHYNRRTHTLVYYHTMDDSLYTPEAIDYGKKKLHQQLQEDIINSVSLKRLKDEGLSFRYVYLAASNGKVCLSLQFDNTDIMGVEQ